MIQPPKYESDILTEEEVLRRHRYGMYTPLGFAVALLDLENEDGTRKVTLENLKEYCLRHGMKERTFYDVLKRIKELQKEGCTSLPV